MGSLAKFLARPAAEQRALLAAIAVVAVVRLSLWVLPFRAIHRASSARGAAPRVPGAPRSAPPERLVWAVEAAARRVPRATCLVRALAAQVLLARHGHASQLRLGVARGAGRAFEAHAWLEGNGRVLIGGGPEERYAALPTLDRRA
jgi:hypothetical protein